MHCCMHTKYECTHIALIDASLGCSYQVEKYNSHHFYQRTGCFVRLQCSFIKLISFGNLNFHEPGVEVTRIGVS